jgi:membrane-associated phospholipid phosphatase
MLTIRASAAALAAGALVAAASPARADAPAGDDAPGGGALHYDPVVSAILTVGLGLGAVATETVFKDAFSPDDCRWCTANGFDERIRDAIRWDDIGAAHTSSNITAFLLAPAAGYGLLGLASWHDGRLGNWIVDGLIVTEAMVVAVTVNNIVKGFAGRERPFVHALPEAEKPETELPQENNLSFYSGHTSLAFSFAAAAGTVATMRRYRWAPVIWSVGGALGAASGYLRIAADKHWFTDVATGAVLGTAIGIATPYFLHRPRRGPIESVSMTPLSGGGAALSLGGRW